MYDITTYPTGPTFPPHLVSHNLIILTIPSEIYKLPSSSLCSFSTSVLLPRDLRSTHYSEQLDATDPMSVDSQLITGRSMTQLSFALHCEVTTFRFEHSQVQKISEEVKTNDVGYYDVLAGEVRRRN